MDVEDKVKFLTDKKCCIRCLDWTHQRESCPIDADKFKCTYKENGSGSCGKDHHKMIHRSNNPVINLSMVIGCIGVEESPILMCVIEVPISNTAQWAKIAILVSLVKIFLVNHKNILIHLSYIFSKIFGYNQISSFLQNLKCQYLLNEKS